MPSGKVLFITRGRVKKLLLLFIAAIVIAVTINIVIRTCFVENPLAGKSFIIDPGHGGIDGGTGSGDFLEKNINLSLALRLKDELDSEGIPTAMTRDTDISLDGQETPGPDRHLRDLAARVSMFNSGGFDMFISIHANYSVSSEDIGPIVLYSGKIPESSQLAYYIQKRMNETASEIYGMRIKNTAVESNAYILRNSNIPGVIIEAGFVSNPAERKLLKDQNHQAMLVGAIMRGITDFYKNIASRPVNNKEENEIPLEQANEIRIVRR